MWVATLGSGLHASIAGMIAGLLIPAFAPRREAVEGAATRFRAFRQSPMPDVGRSAKDALERAVSVNERLQLVLHPWTSYVIVPLFALANAGVDLRGGVLAEALSSPVTWGVVVGLVVGKFLGIGVGGLGGAALRLGRLPQGVGPGQLLGGAALSGIGFTISLLITGLSFDDPGLQRPSHRRRPPCPCPGHRPRLGGVPPGRRPPRRDLSRTAHDSWHARSTPDATTSAARLRRR